MSGKLFIISAPSGAGKTTLINHLVDRLKPTLPISKVITYTTKPPRLNEVAEVDYHFISDAEFGEKIAQGFFLEYSTYNNHYYGSPASIKEELARGRLLCLIVDQAGAARIKQVYEDAVCIWMYPKSITVLEERLRVRNTENETQIKKRLALALQELSNENVGTLFEHHIVNDDFQRALDDFEALIKKVLKKP